MATPPSKNTPSGHPRARKLFLVVAGVLSLLIAAGSGLSITTIKHLETDFGHSKVSTGSTCDTTGCLKHVDSACVQKRCNFLILGSDTRAGLTKQQQSSFGNSQTVQGQRADTIIVVQVDAAKGRTVVLSIPRDLRVNIPGHGTNKINTAFGYGADVMVQTVEHLTGLKINHYVEVNFIGFQSLVNILGGVPICIDKPLIDVLAGLRLTHPGCYNMYGRMALAFVRARHIQGDIIPDFSRISRQQQFIQALIHKVLSVRAVFQLPKFIDAAKNNLIHDDHLDLYGLQDLTIKLATLGQQNVFFRVVPAQPITINGEDFVQLVQPDASTLLERIRDGKALGNVGVEAPGTPISPADITVHVLDAGSGGKADAVASYLQRAGFVVTPVQPATGGLPVDTILWGHGFGKQPKVVASYLSSLRLVEDDQHTVGAQVTVVIGPGFSQAGV